MLTRFEVENYKSIKKLSLDLKPFMVLVGPNGAGKTNVVQALKLFGDIMERGSTAPAAELGWSQIVRREKRPARGGMRLSATIGVLRSQLLLTPAKPRNEWLSIVFSVLLRKRAGTQEIFFEQEELGVSAVDGSLTLRRHGDTVVAEHDGDAELWERFYSVHLPRPATGAPSARFRLESFPDSNLLLHFLLGPKFFWPLARQSQTTRLRLDTSALRSDARFEHVRGAIGASGEGLPVAVDHLRGSGVSPHQAFLPVLRALQEVYPRIEDVVPEPFGQGRVTLQFKERGITDPIPLDGISDGVLHALALLISLRDPGPGILVIEEPENALHPWSIRKILERAQSRTDQRVVMTTHSETVVNAVKDPASLFIVEGDEHSGTTVTPASDKERALTSILSESGQQLGDIWMGGSLGGVPA